MDERLIIVAVDTSRARNFRHPLPDEWPPIGLPVLGILHVGSMKSANSPTTYNEQILARNSGPIPPCWATIVTIEELGTDPTELKQLELSNGKLRERPKPKEPDWAEIKRHRHVDDRKSRGVAIQVAIKAVKRDLDNLMFTLQLAERHDSELETAKAANPIWKLGQSGTRAAIADLARIADTLAAGKLPGQDGSPGGTAR